MPDRIETVVDVNADDIDNQLIAGTLDVAVDGTGVQPAAQARIVADPALRANTDSADTDRLSYVVLNTEVAPLGDVHCRRAVLHAVDRTAFQRANGGSTGGEIATNLLPPVIPGVTPFDLYASPGSQGDVGRARQELQLRGQPGGFATSVSYRSEAPRERATAEALQQSLGRAGIALDLKPYPVADYYTLYAGHHGARENGLGLMVTGWSADWPEGYGFLGQIVDRRTIRPTGGNANLGVRDPQVDLLLDEGLRTTDPAARQRLWAEIDRRILEGRAHFAGDLAERPVLPATDAHESLRHRRLRDVRLSGAGNDAPVAAPSSPSTVRSRRQLTSVGWSGSTRGSSFAIARSTSAAASVGSPSA